MLGILKGLRITLEHALKPKVTRIYPYVKPKLPERSRGLIQLIREEETGVLKCEACLLCEKVCPPRAITIAYKQRGAFRRRPLFRPRTVSGFYKHRMALAAPYIGRLIPSAIDVPAPTADVEESVIETAIRQAAKQRIPDVQTALEAIQQAFGYIPKAAAERVSGLFGVDMSDLYAVVTSSPTFRIKPPALTKNESATTILQQYRGGDGD